LSDRGPEEARFVQELARIPHGLPGEQHASFAKALAVIHLNSKEH